jgi:hypothetical protein
MFEIVSFEENRYNIIKKGRKEIKIPKELKKEKL